MIYKGRGGELWNVCSLSLDSADIIQRASKTISYCSRQKVLNDHSKGIGCVVLFFLKIFHIHLLF